MKSTKFMISLIILFTTVLIVGSVKIVQAVNVQTSTPPVGSGPQTPPAPQPMVTHPSHTDVSPPLRAITPASLIPETQGQERLTWPIPRAHSTTSQDKANSVGLQPQPPRATLNMPAPLQNFAGINNQFGGWPPDTQGDIGLNHYVQWINMHFAIWQIDRVNNTASQVYGPAAGNTLWNNFGGPCETTNDGDPITLYDPWAERWLMSQFALPNYPYGPFYQCIAVSQTSDPTGAWYRYEYQMPVDKMNDYPKFGVWPDAYYMSINQFNGGSGSWGGAGVAAFERDAMLQGQDAPMVYFDLYDVNPNFGGMLPADFDGTTPPPDGAPNYFAEWDDSTWTGDPNDTLRIWAFHVDWDTPANSTFGQNGQPNWAIATGDVDPDLCGGARSCVPQPGTNQGLDPISDRLMYRLQYRNFGDHETLVSNHTVDADGTDHAGIYWFELRKQDADWNLYQEGLYAPDADHRWMGSIAMDQAGNMALGYSVSSASTYPSVRYTGRLNGDPLGTLPQGEAELIAGGGSQTGADRWGDYSMMAVDPVDDCTFWYTQQYVQNTGSNTWTTRIGAFRFPNCMAGAQGILTGIVYDQGGTPQDDPVSYAEVTASLSPNQTIRTNVGTDGSYAMHLLTGTYTVTAAAYGYQTNAINAVAIISGTTTTLDIPLTPATTHVVEGTITDARTGWPLYAHVTVAGDPVSPPVSQDEFWNDPVTGYYSVTLPEGITFTLYAEAWAEGYLPTTRDVGPLTSGVTENLTLTADAETCTAPGYMLDMVYEQDFESDDGGYTHSGTQDEWEWGTPSSWPYGCASSERCWGTDLDDEYDNDADYELHSASIDLSGVPSGTPLTVEWQQAWHLENATYDHAFAEVSINGGPWTEMWRHETTTTQVDWTEMSHDLSAAAGGNVQFRWRMTSDGSVTYSGYYIDQVQIHLGCIPQPGGLIVGNVYDENTGAPLVGATVTHEGGDLATTMATEDPNLDEGFYTLFSTAGSHTFTGTRLFYGPRTLDVTVVQSDTVHQDISLPAGWLSYTPTSYNVILHLGMSTTLPITLVNAGELAADFSLLELERGITPLGPFESPYYVVKPFKQGYSTTRRLKLPAPLPAAPYAAGDVVQSWSAPADAWSIAYTLDETVWVGERWETGNRAYEYLPDGTATGTMHTWDAAIKPADYTFNWQTGMLWAIETDGDNCIHELDPVNGATGRTICPGLSVSQRGLAYDPTTDTYFAGSWNDLSIHRFAADGTLLEQVNVGLAIAGLAYNPDTQHLFVMLNGDPNPVYVLDTADGYAPLGQFTVAGFSSFGGAGLEIDCDGRLWAVDQQTQTVYQFDSGESTTLCDWDVTWLSAAPISGTVAALDHQSLDLTFDADLSNVSQPGQYHTQLKTRQYTPYYLSNVPLTLTVTAPPGWGKLTGTVNGLGHCDISPAPLQNAEVLIQSQTGPTWTVTTDAQGTYEQWLDETFSPFTVTATYSDHVPGLASGVQVFGQTTSVLDLDLRWLSPCVQITPSALQEALISGDTATQILTITNTGAGALNWQLSETPDALPWVSTIPISGLLDADTNALIDVTFDAAALSSNHYTSTLYLDSDDPISPTVSVPLTLTVESATPRWEKQIYVNDVLTTTTPVPLLPGDQVKIVDRVSITFTRNVTFSLAEAWGDALSLQDWAPSGSLQPPGMTVLMDTGVLTWTGTDLPAGQVYVITKTFDVTDNTWGRDYVTETLWVWGASTQPPIQKIELLNQLYGVSLTPATSSRAGVPGHPVTYTLTVQNLGQFQDTFAVTLGNHRWNTTVSTDTVGPLAADASAPLQIYVSVPPTAALGTTDTVTVTVTSQHAPLWAKSTLTTRAGLDKIYLPLVLRQR